jgi:hypothetical protein
MKTEPFFSTVLIQPLLLKSSSVAASVFSSVAAEGICLYPGNVVLLLSPLRRQLRVLTATKTPPEFIAA